MTKDTITPQAPTLLLLRHGQIKANKQRRWHGSTDSDLTFKGRRQARRTGRRLRDRSIAAIYASPLKRCHDTATLATEHLDLPIHSEPGLREMSIGDWEDTLFSTLHTDHQLFRHLTEDQDYCPPQGESIRDVSERMLSTLKSISNGHAPEETVLIVTHGVAIGVALASLLDQQSTLWQEYHIGNCSLTHLCLEPEPYTSSIGDDHHL
jgi:broad specificity phosphatase PhoE